jgi:hypothetical protein
VGSKVYIGILCDSCDYSLKVRYVKEEQLKAGESRLLHLKAGDKAVFKVDESLENEKSIIISSYNLKNSKYQMNVDIVGKAGTDTMIKVPIQNNWIGGQMASIVNNENAKFEYKVTLNAVEDSVISIEARSSSSIIPINDKSMRFDSIKPDEGICYRYNIDKADLNLIIQAKSIEGDLVINAFPESVKDKNVTFKVATKKDNQFTLSSEIRQAKQSPTGNWLICVKSEQTAYFQLNAYLETNTEAVKEYKKLLFSKIFINIRLDQGNRYVQH